MLLVATTAHDLWWVGVLLCLSGSISLNFGNNMQSLGLQGYETGATKTRKLADDASYRTARVEEPGDLDGGRLAENANGENISAERRSTGDGVIEVVPGHMSLDSPAPLANKPVAPAMYSPRLFYLGTAMFIVGSVLTFVAFGFAAQSLLASLEGVQFVSNVVFAKCMRGTTITYNVIAGSMMIVLGIGTVVVMGSHSSTTLTTKEIESLYANPEYLTFLWFLGSAAVFLRYTEKAYSKRVAQGKAWPRSKTIIPVTYAAFSAIFGTQMVTQAKCLMMVLKHTVNGHNQFKFGFTYIMLAVFLLCAWVWLYRMGRALKRFDPMFIIPVLQVCFILFAIVTGGIFFQEFYSFGAFQSVGFVMGVVLVCLGLYLLAPSGGDLDSDIPVEDNKVEELNYDEAYDSRGDDIEKSDGGAGSVDEGYHRSPQPLEDPVALRSLGPMPMQSFGIRGDYMRRGSDRVMSAVETLVSVVADDVVDTLTETVSAPANMASVVAASARGAANIATRAAQAAEASGPNGIIDEVEQHLNAIDWRATTAQLNLIAAAQDEGVDYGVDSLQESKNPMHHTQGKTTYVPAHIPGFSATPPEPWPERGRGDDDSNSARQEL